MVRKSGGDATARMRARHLFGTVAPAMSEAGLTARELDSCDIFFAGIERGTPDDGTIALHGACNRIFEEYNNI